MRKRKLVKAKFRWVHCWNCGGSFEVDKKIIILPETCPACTRLLNDAFDKKTKIKKHE